MLAPDRDLPYPGDAPLPLTALLQLLSLWTVH